MVIQLWKAGVTSRERGEKQRPDTVVRLALSLYRGISYYELLSFSSAKQSMALLMTGAMS